MELATNQRARIISFAHQGIRLLACNRTILRVDEPVGINEYHTYGCRECWIKIRSCWVGLTVRHNRGRTYNSLYRRLVLHRQLPAGELLLCVYVLPPVFSKGSQLELSTMTAVGEPKKVL